MLCGWVGHITTKARLSEWSKEPDLRDSNGIISNLVASASRVRTAHRAKPLVYGLNILSSPIV